MLPRNLSTVYKESHHSVLLLIANLHHACTQDNPDTYDKKLVLDVIQEIESYMDLENLFHIKKQAFSLEDVIAKAVSQYNLKASKKTIQFHIQETDSQVPIEGYAPLIKIILNNLISNAIKHTEQGTLTLKINALQDTIEIKVIDTGAGMDAHTVAAIFEHEQLAGKASSERGNSGLGLINCLKIAKCINGSLTATSAGKGKGSCFSLKIPTKMALETKHLLEIFDQSFIHHEIRNLLSTLLIQENLSDEIIEKVENIINLVTDLLDYALLEQDKLQLRNAIIDLKTLFPDAKNPIFIYGDPSRVAQVIRYFQHLNSEKAIDLETSAETVHWRLRLDSPYTADDLTAQVCQLLLAKMGGKITTEGKETLISCSFPRALAQEMSIDNAKKKILIIEDSLITINLLTRFLTKLGHEVVEATNAEQALVKISHAAATEEQYDAILTDLHIGSGLTGIDLARKIHQSAAHTNIYLLTGDNISSELCEQAGIKQVMQKPVSFEKLSNVFGNPAGYVKTPLVSTTPKLMPDSPLQTTSRIDPILQQSLQQSFLDLARPK
jgi:signal transduction histidine kinase/ActR/RegA family two-component response regulator